MIENGNSGLLFPVNAPNAVSELSVQIVRLLNDPVLAKEIATRARESIDSGFGSLHPVRKFEQLVDAMVRHARA
jgi:hypothetical protein